MVLICWSEILRYSATSWIRPLAGIMVLILYKGMTHKEGSFSNPSPCGDYGSYRDYLYPYFKGDRKGIRPLAGIMVLIGKKIPSWWRLGKFRIRPLAGIMVLISSECRERLSRNTIESVPLRGLWFLSTERQLNSLRRQYMNPSPCGDYGSYLLRGHISMKNLEKIKNPSPCGDYGSYLKGHADTYKIVSYGIRPLAGIMVLIARHSLLNSLYFMRRNPSPCGDYGSYPHPL